MKKKASPSADVSNVDKSKYVERRKFRPDVDLPISDSGKVDDAIVNFLRSSSDEFGGIPNPENLELTQNVSTPTRKIIRYQQLHDKIPILDSYVVAQLDKAGKIKQLDLGVTSKTETVKPAAIGDTRITPQEAIKHASSIGEFVEREKIKEPEFVYYPTRSGLRLAYKVLILTQEPAHDWRIIIDAHTGEVLEKRDLIFEVDGTGQVFDPNPVVTANDNTFRDPTATVPPCNFAGTAIATIDAQRVDRVLKDITFSGGTHKLEGPFVKLRNFNAPNIAPPQEADPNNFKYSSGDPGFEAVMIYYHIDTIQRYIQSLGITTALNSQIEADAHDNSGPGGGHGAFYSANDKGIHFGDSNDCRTDRGEDADAMVHEYGHAIQDNQVPGWGVQNPVTMREETRAMGEGFGDILACVYFAEKGGRFQREVFEDWVFADRGGLRRVDGTKIYPTDWDNISEHENGEIWSAALWNVYRTIGGDSAIVTEREAARDALLKTVILSHHRLTVDASMSDGAEAVMEENAELDEYRGKHLMQMLDSFHDRGLLVTSLQADLYIREALDDPGADTYLGPVFWDSPDLWIRNADDGIPVHQNPKHGQDNWFYARIHNRGTVNARAFVVTFNVKLWAGTQFVYPSDFVPYISAAVAFNLAPGSSTIVKAKWPSALVPVSGTGDHCLLALVYMPTDVSPAGKHVWEYNNLAQKNSPIVELMPDESTTIPFNLGSLHTTEPGIYRIEVRRPQEWINMPVSIVHKDPQVVKGLLDSIEEEAVAISPAPGPSLPKPTLHFLEQTRTEILTGGTKVRPIRINFAKGSTLDIGTLPDESAVQQAGGVEFSAHGREAVITPEQPEGRVPKSASIVFKAGPIAGFPTVLKPRSQIRLGLKITAPAEAKQGDVLKIHLVQRNRQGLVVGGIAAQLNII